MLTKLSAVVIVMEKVSHWSSRKSLMSHISLVKDFEFVLVKRIAFKSEGQSSKQNLTARVGLQMCIVILSKLCEPLQKSFDKMSVIRQCFLVAYTSVRRVSECH